MTPLDLIAAATTIAGAADRKFGTSRYLAASLLLRQALEAALDEFWLAKAPGMHDANGRVQLVSLPFFIDDIAHDVVYAWYRLSSACHHNVYDLPPTPAEFDHYLDVTTRCVHALLAPESE